MVESANTVQDAGFAGAVGSYDGENFTGIHCQTDTVESAQATET
jgi:hypothetical protein